MELEKAKEIVQKLVAWFNLGNKSTTLNPEEFEAIVMVSQELERLQKENEKLKEIDLTTVHIKGVFDEKERWRNKIKEEKEKYKAGVDCTYCNNTCSRYAICQTLQDLLKEE